MITPPLLLRLWRTARYRRLMRELLTGRPEGALLLEQRLAGPLPAAAFGLIRFGELNQADLPLAAEFRQRLLMSQGRSGAWGDGPERAMLTAICIRALATDWQNPAALGEAPLGIAIEPPDRLGRLHASVGPAATIAGPRQPAMSRNEALCGAFRALGGGKHGGLGNGPTRDAVSRGIAWLAFAQSPGGGWGDDEPFESGFVLLQLGRMTRFREAVRIGDALAVRPAPPAMAGMPAEVRQVWSRLDLRCGRALRLAASREGRRQGESMFAAVA